MADNPYETPEGQSDTQSQSTAQQKPLDQSKPPSYPYLMSGQQGWPTMDQQIQPYAPPTGGITGGQQPPASAPAPTGYNREQYRDSWMGSGVKDMAGLENFVKQNGGQIVSGNGTVLTPSGEYIDMLIGARSGGNGSAGWTGINGGAGDPRNSGQTGGYGGGGMTGGGFSNPNIQTLNGSAGGGSFGGGSNYSSTSGATGSNLGGKSDSLYNILMGRAGQSLNVNGRDPIVANQVDSFRAEQTRGTRDALKQQAEAGGPQDNMNMERRMLNEKASQATGGLQASLMQNELNARRQEIQNALSQAGGMLSQEQQMGLQRELGMLNASIQQQQVTNQNNQFRDRFGLDLTNSANLWDWRRSGGEG